MKKKEKEVSKVGGLFYFSAVFCAIPLSLLCILLSVQSGLLFQWRSLEFLLFSILGIAISLLIRGHWATYVHELKHAILANLAGDRYDKISVAEHTGAFSYRYTKATAHSNAFIALAPYFVPLFGSVALLGSPLFPAGSWQRLGLLGVTLGMDLALALRDLGPWQTDFSRLRGGFYFAFLYVISVQLMTLFLVLLWGLDGWSAWKDIADRFAELVVGLANLIASARSSAG